MVQCQYLDRIMKICTVAIDALLMNRCNFILVSYVSDKAFVLIFGKRNI